MRSRILFLALTFFGTPARAACVDVATAFDDWIQPQVCMWGMKSCLQPVVVNVCSSGCPRRGYNVSYTDSPLGWPFDATDRQEIHLTHEYLKQLRNAAAACPEEVLARNSFGMKLKDLLWHQTELYLRHWGPRYFNPSLTEVPVSAVLSGNNVNAADPDFYFVTFPNENDTAHAMTQVDFGLWLLTVGQALAANGQSASMYHYLRLSERVLRALQVPDNLGGVRNNRTQYRCFNSMYCYWYHSQPVESFSWPSTVLNQNLHAIRDLMAAHTALAVWRDGGYPGVPMPAEFNTVYIDQLKEMARGGLFQLAHSAGNKLSGVPQVGVTAPPPNLSDFLQPQELIAGIMRYSAFYLYRFHPDEVVGHPAGGAPAQPENDCHYHYHNLQLLHTILGWISGSGALPQFSGDSHYVGAYYKLLYGRSPGNTQSCVSGSNFMRGVPLAELFRGSVLDLSFQSNCDGAPAGEYDDSAQFKAPVGERGDYEAARAFFDGVYAGCTF